MMRKSNKKTKEKIREEVIKEIYKLISRYKINKIHESEFTSLYYYYLGWKFAIEAVLGLLANEMIKLKNKKGRKA